VVAGLGDEDALVVLVADATRVTVTSSEMKPMVPVRPRRSDRAAGLGR
jgi:hypothetical protein